MKRITFGLLVVTAALGLVGCAHDQVGVSTEKTMQQNYTAYQAKQAAEANIKLGLNYLRQGNTAMAKKKLYKAVTEAPKLAKAQYSWGYYLNQVGEHKAAQAAYEKALTLAPNDPDVLNSYGVFLCLNKQPKQSIDYFKKAAEVPGFQYAGLAYRNAGLCALDIPDQVAAQHFFEHAVKVNNKLPLAYLHLAEIYSNQQYYQKAQQSLAAYQKLVAKPSAAAQKLAKHLQMIQQQMQAKQQAEHTKKVQAQQTAPKLDSTAAAQHN